MLYLLYLTIIVIPISVGNCPRRWKIPVMTSPEVQSDLHTWSKRPTQPMHPTGNPPGPGWTPKVGDFLDRFQSWRAWFLKPKKSRRLQVPNISKQVNQILILTPDLMSTVATWLSSFYHRLVLGYPTHPAPQGFVPQGFLAKRVELLSIVGPCFNPPGGASTTA